MEWLKSLFPNLRDAAIRWTEDDASSMAASVAYLLGAFLFPLVLLLTSGLGLFLHFTRLGQDAEQQLLATVSVNASPTVEQQFRDILSQMRGHSVITGPTGLLGAIMAAIGVFAQLDRGFDKIWRIPPRKGATYAVPCSSDQGSLLGVYHAGQPWWHDRSFVCGQYAVAHFRSLADTTLPSLAHVLQVFDMAATLSANAVLFALAYRMLPKKKVGWIEALRGGLLAAAVWELGCIVLGMFLIGMRYTMAYGAIGSFIAILLWCYYGVSIFFLAPNTSKFYNIVEKRKKPRNAFTFKGPSKPHRMRPFSPSRTSRLPTCAKSRADRPAFVGRLTKRGLGHCNYFLLLRKSIGLNRSLRWMMSVIRSPNLSPT